MDLSAILGGLNPAQQAAVTSPSPVLQILAPPGSGKTKTLTARVAYLLGHHGYHPANTICLTFTIKSAREMKERIARLIGDGLEKRLVLGTFHSVCRRYLVTYGHLIGLKKGFGIADSADSIAIVKRIAKRLKATLQPNVIRSRISRCKARRAGLDELRREAAAKRNHAEQEEFLRVYQDYEAHLAASNLLDYDDLLLRCVDLLHDHPACVSNVEAVLIDEFQDTNSVQFDLMRLFAARHQRITTVGDPDQSIYGWRSAEIKNLTKMQTLYPDTLVLNLEINYRSSEAILAAAREVIEQDTARPWKPLQPSHGCGTLPVLRLLPSSHAEATWIVSEIRRYMTLTGGTLLNCSDFAILLRSASLSRQIESALGRAGLPYRMVGGARFFDRVEIKILLNYLRVIASPNNSEALAAIINVPPRRIGDVTIKSLQEESRTKAVSLFALLRGMLGGAALTTKLTKPAETALGTLINIILTAQKKLADEALFYPPDVLTFVLKRLEYKDYLTNTYPEEIDARWANVEELAAQAADPAFGLPGDDPDEESLPAIGAVAQAPRSSAAEEALTKFLSNVALATELQTADGGGDAAAAPRHRITISTIHAAKGLEWPVVFIPAAFHGSIPHSRADDTDEERRLLYVAMTRAQALLALSRPLYSSTGDETEASEFTATHRVRGQFAARGPSMSPAAIQQIATILGRATPSEERTTAALLQAENIEDDLWTAEGAKAVPEAESESWRAPKRRRVEGRNGNTRASTVDDHDSEVQFMRSNPVPVRFQSAATQLHTTMTATTMAAPPSNSIALSAPASRVKAGGPMQRTLQSLWTPGPTPLASTTAPTPLPLLAHPAQPARVAWQQPRYTLPPAAAPSSPLSPKDSNPRAHGGSLDAQGKDSLPPNLQHRVQTAKFARPSFTTTTSSNKPGYVFLSSSPPPPDEAAPASKGQSAAPPAPSATSVAQADVRPAASFHYTSMAQVRCQSTKNRSLGVRRGLGGLGGHHHPKPFKPPRPVGR